MVAGYVCRYAEQNRDCKICVLLNVQKKKKCALGKRSFPKQALDLISIDFTVTNIEWQQ